MRLAQLIAIEPVASEIKQIPTLQLARTQKRVRIDQDDGHAALEGSSSSLGHGSSKKSRIRSTSCAGVTPSSSSAGGTPASILLRNPDVSKERGRHRTRPAPTAGDSTVHRGFQMGGDGTGTKRQQLSVGRGPPERRTLVARTAASLYSEAKLQRDAFAEYPGGQTARGRGRGRGVVARRYTATRRAQVDARRTRAACSATLMQSRLLCMRKIPVQPCSRAGHWQYCLAHDHVASHDQHGGVRSPTR